MRALLPIVVASLAIARPAPAGDLDAPQSPPLPPPFPVTLVDQGKADPRLAGLLAPAGFKVEVAADAPVVVNPVAMTFAPDGTLFVAEWATDPVLDKRWFELKETVRYRDGSARQVATMRKFVADVVKVLTPDPATGTYTKAKAVIPEELPSTLLWHDGWLYTAGRGTVRRYKQSRKNGPWDVREVVAQGFCGFHHHQVSGLSIGLDGKLYITSGDDDNVAEGADGSRATALRTGAVFRCNPDGTKLELYSLGYRNPYRDLCHDAAYNWFHADNDNEDGSKFTGCRLVHVAEGVDYGWRLRDGARCCQPDFVRGAVAGERPGALPPMAKTGRGAPAGLLAYHDTKLPDPYRGLLFYPDVFRRLVRAYKVAPTGSTFKVTHEVDLLKSADPLFRPCQMVTGPDGAVYVCDWRTDSGGAGRLSGDGQHGRIYRLTWTGTPEHPALPPRPRDSWAKLVKLPTPELVAALDRPDLSDREVARKELVRRGEPAHAAVLAAFAAGTLHHAGRLEAVGVLQTRWTPAVAGLFVKLTADPSGDVRRLAADALGQHASGSDAPALAALTKLVDDPNPAVRRAAALGLGRAGGHPGAERLAAAWVADDGRDRFLGDAYLRGLEAAGRAGAEAVLHLARSKAPADREKAVAAFAAFRTRPMADALPALLTDAPLDPDQKAAAVRSAANYQLVPPLDLEPLAAAVARGAVPPAVTTAMLDVLSLGGYTAGPAATGFVLAHLAVPDPAARLAALKAAATLKLTAAAEPVAGKLGDPAQPLPDRLAMVAVLRAVGSSTTAPALAGLFDKPEPAELKVASLKALASLDPAAADPLAVRLLDDPNPLLLTEAAGVLAATKDGTKRIAERYLAKTLPGYLYPRVTSALAQYADDPEVKGLSDQLKAGGLTLSADPAQAADLVRLAKAKGDAGRGRELFRTAEQVACASCHKLEGTGGDVGPDLTRVWDTHSPLKLVEAILDPSREIKEGYQAYRAVQADGRVYTGLKVSEAGGTVTLREATGAEVRLARAELEELAPLKVSLMPADSIGRLSLDQFLDLLAFLSDRQAQEALRPAAPPQPMPAPPAGGGR